MWAATYAATLTVGFLVRLHRYLASLAGDQPFSFWPYFLLGLPQYLVLNPLRIVAVWMLADRFRFDRDCWRRNAVVHGGASLLLTHAYLMAQTAIVMFVETPATRAFAAALEGRPGLAGAGIGDNYLDVLRTGFQPQFLWYWAIIGVDHAYHHYLESREQRVRAAELQANLMEARFERLRSQLSPHFLFNTLNTISVLALRGEREPTTEALELLGSLLRTSLDDTRPERVAVEQEVGFIEQYLGIQRLRFSGRLTTRYEIAPDVARAEVPAMILQPVIENAVKYGVLDREGLGAVSLRAWRDDGRLVLQVADTGPGFSSDSFSKGIGLRSVEARLEHLYGSAHRIAYGTSETGGSVTISIPFTRMPGTLREPES